LPLLKRGFNRLLHGGSFIGDFSFFQKWVCHSRRKYTSVLIDIIRTAMASEDSVNPLLKRFDRFYFFFYIFDCPKCETPVQWSLRTIAPKPDEGNLERKCSLCGHEFTVKLSQAVWTRAFEYRDRKCYPFRTEDTSSSRE
jgi:endogenous inhibitor of DNA gyrase (YacG/DUF329 family)